MKQIKLTQGQYALVDDVDYDWLMQWKWCAYRHRSGVFYAVRQSSWVNGKRHLIRMSRQILGLEQGDKREADHIYHNTLDNRRSELRICTHQQNLMNQKGLLNTYSQFKGVSWHKRHKKWQVYIRINGKQKYLGLFVSEKNAAFAYNRAAKVYFKEFACLNLI